MAEEETKVPQYSMPFVRGTIAWWMGKKATETANSHRWTAYVRGNNNEDLSHCVEKVVFRLHSSFASPVRELTKPPYEVTETGWGEFEIPITIHFRDPDMKPITVHHLLKLYPPGNQPQTTAKPVVSEFYDEVLFTAPPPTFSDLLAKREPVHVPGPHPSAQYWKSFDDTDDLHAIQTARVFVAREIEGLKAQLLDAEGRIHSYKQDIVRLGGSAV